MSQVFLNSNVVLYLLSADENKTNKAEALLTQRPFIGVQVLNAVTSICRRKLSTPWAEIQDLLSILKASCTVIPLTVDTHAQALQIAQQHQLSIYDAHIVSAAWGSGTAALMTENMLDGMVIGPITIQNPFVVH